jgi:taurine dioxygenase
VAHVRTRRRIEARPLTPVIGAEVVGVDLASAAGDEATMGAIAHLLHEHLVLFFRGQEHLTPEQQIAFAGWFGPFEYHPFAKPHPDYPEMTVLDQVTPEKDGANSWHSDTSFMETPALGSVLRAVQLPTAGGDTCWASMYAAWDALSAPLREMLEHLDALHDIVVPLEKAIAGGHSTSIDVAAVRAAWPPTAHPVARTHPATGRKCLYVNNNFTTRIVGLTAEESDPLLRFLLGHVQRPDFQVRFRWEPGSVAFWDNRCTQHYAVPDYSGQRRVMHRVAITGERPG